ncbi:ComEC/Rec2 family competence protein [Psychrobacter sp. HD31]|uniref:ComEC/Rec2 family competence protein n=1 Tax=Psychrobacter sp. HD31 TaxID=3112003 RepID=UPI003DA491D3
MKWWIISLVSVVLMLAMLAIAPNVNLPPVTNSINGFLSVFILVASLILWLLAIFIDKKSSRQHFLPNFLFLQLPNVLKLFAVLLILLTSIVQAMVATQQAQSNELKQPQRVVAMVKIEGISDSVYQYNDNDNSADMGYRQIATIVDAKPLLVNLQKKPNNTNHFNDITPDTTSIQPLIKKRLLMSAYPTLKNKKHHPEFTKLNKLAPNQLATLTLELTKIPANKQSKNTAANTQKFNEHRWLRTRHIDAQAKILAINQLNLKTVNQTDKRFFSGLRYQLNQMRFNVRQHFLLGWSQLSEAEQQAKAVTLSLLTGDRALINKATKNLYQLAGISHLLAISGTHVLFLALLVSMLVTAIINRFVVSCYFVVPRWLVRWIIMILVAAVYALFTGFDVPAARTFWMLVAVGGMRLFFMRISSYQVLLLVAMIMAWIDPFVLWQAGFWLSFVAVGLLISFEVSSGGNHKTNQSNMGLLDVNQQFRVFTDFLRLIKVQVWMFVTLLPLSLLLFGKVSWWGLLVNIFAIGLYGWVIVPLNLLAGLIFLLSPDIAQHLWHLVNHILLALHSFLNDILIGDINRADAWIYTQINAGIILVAIFAILPWLMPKGMINRLFSLPPILLLGFVLYNQTNISAQQPKLGILQTKDAYITAQVLQTHTDNWLIVADHLSANSRYKRRLTDMNVMQNLQAQLGSLGVNHLTGIIVQSPSKVLASATQALVAQMPVAQVWQAGVTELNTTKTQDTFIEPLPCTAGAKWMSEDGSVTIKAITGWKQISHTAMHNCALLVSSNKLIEVVSQFDSAWANLTTNNTALPFNNKTNSLMIDISTDKKLWQVWEQLCQNDISHNQQKATKRMWLLHSSSQVDKAIVNIWQADNAIISDEINQYNQLKSKQKLLELTHLQD